MEILSSYFTVFTLDCKQMDMSSLMFFSKFDSFDGDWETSLLGIETQVKF